jgi:HrpA-like RNA helicase
VSQRRDRYFRALTRVVARRHRFVLFQDSATPAVVAELPTDRPIQITSDLGGFWAGSWAEVRKEMAGSYPKRQLVAAGSPTAV